MHATERRACAQVDHLKLRGNRRYTHTRSPDGWKTSELNP
jgi:hypothetical protein